MAARQHVRMRSVLHLLVVVAALLGGLGELLKLQAWRLRERRPRRSA